MIKNLHRFLLVALFSIAGFTANATTHVFFVDPVAGITDISGTDVTGTNYPVTIDDSIRFIYLTPDISAGPDLCVGFLPNNAFNLQAGVSEDTTFAIDVANGFTTPQVEIIQFLSQYYVPGNTNVIPSFYELNLQVNFVPLANSSILAVQNTTFGNELTWSSKANSAQQVYTSNNGINWRLLTTIENQTSGNYNYTVTNPSTGDNFYKVVFNNNGVAEASNIVKTSNVVAGFSIYPNPASNNIEIKSAIAVNSISFRNVIGNTVANITVVNNSANISNLQAGIYLATVHFANGTFASNKIIKL